MTAGCWWSPQRTRTAPSPGLWARGALAGELGPGLDDGVARRIGQRTARFAEVFAVATGERIAELRSGSDPASTLAVADAGPRAGLGPGAPGHPERPRQPGPLDRGGGGPGAGAGPVRRAAPGLRAHLGPGAPRHPDHPRRARLLGSEGTRRRLAPCLCLIWRASDETTRSPPAVRRP